jgi:hypothetical protein
MLNAEYFRLQRSDFSVSLHVFIQDLLEGCFVGETHDLFDDLPPLEQEEGRNAANAESAGYVWILVDIQLSDDDLAIVLAGKLIDGRRQPAAGPAPLRPEINEHDLPAVDCLLEVAVGQRLYLFGCHRFPFHSPVPYTL